MTLRVPSDIRNAVNAVRAGRMVIMTDDEDRENEGDLVFAAQFATPQNVNFMARNACGLICMPMTAERLDALGIGMMVNPARNKSRHNTPFTVSVEAASGITTGISAFDRAHTIRTACAAVPDPESLVTPGHIFPLKAHRDGLLGRDGHTEGSVDLMRLAGLEPASVICEIMAPDGTMMRGDALRDYARKYDLPIISIASLTQWIKEHGTKALDALSAPETASCDVPQSVRANLPDAWAGDDLKIQVFNHDGQECVALTKGDLSRGTPLVRLHSACLTGDALGSLRCDCGPQLREALRRVGESECGAVLYLTGHEGRGIGLANKIRAYSLQDKGMDTLDANLALGFHADERDFSGAVRTLKDLGVKRLKLLTNNPEKEKTLRDAGFEIAGIERLQAGANKHNQSYLDTKRTRMGHSFD